MEELENNESRAPVCKRKLDWKGDSTHES